MDASGIVGTLPSEGPGLEAGVGPKSPRHARIRIGRDEATVVKLPRRGPSQPPRRLAENRLQRERRDYPDRSA